MISKSHIVISRYILPSKILIIKILLQNLIFVIKFINNYTFGLNIHIFPINIKNNLQNIFFFKSFKTNIIPFKDNVNDYETHLNHIKNINIF